MKAILFRLLYLLILFCCHAAHGQSVYQFVENKGQWPVDVRFSAELKSGRVFFERNAFTFHYYDMSEIQRIHNTGVSPKAGELKAKGHVFQQQLLNASPRSVYGKTVNAQRYSFFLGNDASKWAGNCRSYQEVYYDEIYSNVGLRYYSEDFNLKYDWVIKPGGDPNVIRWNYEGAKKVSLEDGRLIIQTSVGDLIEQKPIAYQIIDGKKKLVPCEFEMLNGNIGFHFPKSYDKSFELIIDPILVFSTYSGSTSDNFGYTATYDSEGNLYSGSSAFGNGYPTTLGAYQTTWAGGDGGGLPGTDIAISKYSSDGSTLIWSSFLGGPNDELPHSLICNAEDEVLMYGTTSSPSFPVTAGAFDTVFNGGSSFAPQGVGTDYVNGSDMVVVRFNQDGSDLIASTFLGGTANDGVNTSTVLKFNYADEFRGEIDIDENGQVIIAGCTYSINFPTVNAFQSLHGGALDGCIVSLSEDLTQINWSSFYGGNGDDVINSVSFFENGDYVFCGGTTSQNLSGTFGNYQGNYIGGSSDAFITRVSGSSIFSSTYFGGNEYDQLFFVEVDDQEDVVVFGQSLTNGSGLVINAGWSVPNSGMLVSKFDASLDNVVWSTVFGSGNDRANLSPAAFTVDVCGKIYLSGWGGQTNTSTNPNTGSTIGLPITADAYQSTTDGSDFYMLVIESDASELVYGSFFGGGISQEHVDGGTSRFDKRGIIYQSVCAGCGSNDDFPIFPIGNVVSATNNSFNCNNAVYKFDFQLPFTVADFTVNPVVCIGQPIEVNNLSQFGQTFQWDFGGEFFSDAFEPSYTFSSPGEYEIQLLATNPNTCNAVDSVQRIITVVEPQSSALSSITACNDETVVIGPSDYSVDALFEWVPSDFLSDPTDPNPIFSPGNSTEYTLLIRYGVCTDTIRQEVNVFALDITASDDIVLCEPETIDLFALASVPNAFYTWSFNANGEEPILEGEQATELSYSFDSPETLYVIAASNGCEVVEEIEVNLVSFQTVIDGDFTACAGDIVTLSVQSPNPDFEYLWSPSELILSGQNTSEVQLLVSETTVIFIQSITPFGCSAEDEVTISVSDLLSQQIDAAANPAVIFSGQTTTLTATPPNYNIQWEPSALVADDDNAITTANPQESTTFFLTISDGECVARDSVRVVVAEFVCGPPFIYVPNAFTPNEDNRNERLFVRANNVDEIVFRIYNRWGELVFETEDIKRGWDGTFREKPVDPAVYVYYLEATCAGGQQYIEKGNITVIR